MRIRNLSFLLGVEKKKIKESLEELKKELEERKSGLSIREVAGGYEFHTLPEYSKWIERFIRRRKTESLSPSAMETLAIVAYKQPVTRQHIEKIRGVNSETTLRTLLEKRLIRISGRKKSMGAPFLYRTTEKFLQEFGLRSLDDLPRDEKNL